MQRSIDKSQIKILHILASKLGLTDGEYRAMLAGYPKATGDGHAASSKDLSFPDARNLINILEHRAIRAGVWQKPTGRADREGIQEHEPRGGFRGDMASPKQIDKLEALWSLASRVQDAEGRAKALDMFIHRRFHRGGIRMVERSLVHKIVKAIEAMIEQSRTETTEVEEVLP